MSINNDGRDNSNNDGNHGYDCNVNGSNESEVSDDYTNCNDYDKDKYDCDDYKDYNDYENDDDNQRQ